jgi:hypothetical protein
MLGRLSNNSDYSKWQLILNQGISKKFILLLFEEMYICTTSVNRFPNIPSFTASRPTPSSKKKL